MGDPITTAIGVGVGSQVAGGVVKSLFGGGGNKTTTTEEKVNYKPVKVNVGGTTITMYDPGARTTTETVDAGTNIWDTIANSITGGGQAYEQYQIDREGKKADAEIAAATATATAPANPAGAGPAGSVGAVDQMMADSGKRYDPYNL